MTPEQAARFWAKVDKSGECWIWTGPKTKFGHGTFMGHGAHRIAWELERGPIPPGICICHNCPGGDNPACIRPAHMFQGTQVENTADRVAKGRSTRANGKPRILSLEKAREIRARYAAGETPATLAREFGCKPQNISRIVNGSHWREPEDTLRGRVAARRAQERKS